MDRSTSRYYTKVDKTTLNTAKNKLTHVLQEAFDNDLITQDEFRHMDPDGKSAAKFYMTFKVHNEHEHGKATPERPICSGCGSMFYNVSKLEHHIKEIGTTHITYFQDTQDFYRYNETINKQGTL